LEVKEISVEIFRSGLVKVKVPDKDVAGKIPASVQQEEQEPAVR
jgi:hypothetical protein